MIVKALAPGDLSNHLMLPYPEDRNTPAPMLHSDDTSRASSVLAPNGEPFRIERKLRRIGFDLTPRT